MLEWLQMMNLAAGQSDHQCCFFIFFSSSLNNRIRQIVCDLCQGFAGNTEASSSNCASLRHVWICKAPLVFLLFFHARFQHENVKLFGNLLPCRAFTERSHIELSSARMFDAASLVEHMPHSVLGRLCLCGGLFPQSCNSGHGEEGLVRGSSCPALCEHYDMHDLVKKTR